MATTTNSLNITNSGVVAFDSATGLFSESALTQYDVLVGGASNAITSVSPGTAGFVLTSNGISADPSFQAPASSSTSTTYVASTPYTVLASDDIILVDTAAVGGPVSVVLIASPLVDGKVWTIKDFSGGASSNNITVTVSGGANIDGASSFVLNQDYQSVSIDWSLSETAYSVVYDYQTAAAGSITIAGDSGSITGTSLTIYSNNAAQNAGCTVAFANSGTTSTLNVTDASQNTIIGAAGGNATISGLGNTGLGNQVFTSLTSGLQNTLMGVLSGNLMLTNNDCVGIGYNTLAASTADTALVAVGSGAMALLDGGSNNVAIGTGAMGSSVTPNTSVAVGSSALASTSGTDNLNVGVGNYSLLALNGGSFNSSCGGNSGDVLTTGSYNAFYGYHAGHNYTGSESSNVLINSNGTLGESNTLRIGASTGTGNQSLNRAFIRGINGVTSSNPLMVTINSSTDQLGVLAIPEQNLTWTDEATSFTAVVNNGYFCTAALTATLPATPAQGQIVEIIVANAVSVVIQASGSQAIRFGTTASTTGGTATSTARGDTVKLIYRATSNLWFAFSSSGSWILA